jgi:dihydrofolate reductase
MVALNRHATRFSRSKDTEMRKLIVFNNVSIDGYFTDAHGDMSFAHNMRPDAEWQAYVASNASGEGELVFGRVTYDMMASFWPTPAALERMPEVAAGMNRARTVVFSRTMAEAGWNNARLLKGDPATEVRKLKSESGGGMCILGSGTIVAQLAEAGLIDEFHNVVVPIVMGKGRTQFESVVKRLEFDVKASRAFANGNVLTVYTPRK